MADKIEFSTKEDTGIEKRILFQAMELIMNNLKENMEHIDQNLEALQFTIDENDMERLGV